MKKKFWELKKINKNQSHQKNNYYHQS